MVGETEQVKREEQCPLLKMETGGALSQTPPPTVSPGWNVACKPKRSWLNRWPEYVSACWMTFILLGITLLVFYGLGMNGFRRKPLVIVKYNNSKPENNVFFHQIIPRDNYLRFTIYCDYLSSMAIEYPFLQINVIFLLDDSLQNSLYRPKHLIFKRFGTSVIYNKLVSMSDTDERELRIFHQRYRNVNVSIIPLSHYMAMTPLRYKWKMIPTFYLPFYARIFAVWEYGGIGMDLTTFNNQYNIYRKLDRRITAVLKQHNDGIEERRYIQALNTINREEEIEFFDMFYNLMTSILNSSYSFFDNFPYNVPGNTENKRYISPISRNYRNINRNPGLPLNNSIEDMNDSRNLIRVKPLVSSNDLHTFALSSIFGNSGKKFTNPTVNNGEHTTVNQSKEIDKKLETKLATTNKNWESNWYNLIMNSSLDTTNGINNTIILKNEVNLTSNDQIPLKNISDPAGIKFKDPNKIEIEVNGKILNATHSNTKNVVPNLLSESIKNRGPINDEREPEKALDINIQNKGPEAVTVTEVPHVVLFYDFSIISDGIGPLYFSPEVHSSQHSLDSNILREPVKKSKRRAYLLSVASDGTFVAATARRHPFLGHILSSGCKRVNPKFAIEDTVFSQCSGFTRNDVYCDTIYIID